MFRDRVVLLSPNTRRVGTCSRVESLVATRHGYGYEYRSTFVLASTRGPKIVWYLVRYTGTHVYVIVCVFCSHAKTHTWYKIRVGTLHPVHLICMTFIVAVY